MSLNSRVFLYKSFWVACLAIEQWLWVDYESFILDIWFILFDEHFDTLIMIIKINHGATTRENSATTRTTWLWSWLIN